jgi:hypothetical protein
VGTLVNSQVELNCGSQMPRSIRDPGRQGKELPNCILSSPSMHCTLHHEARGGGVTSKSAHCSLSVNKAMKKTGGHPQPHCLRGQWVAAVTPEPTYSLREISQWPVSASTWSPEKQGCLFKGWEPSGRVPLSVQETGLGWDKANISE